MRLPNQQGSNIIYKDRTMYKFDSPHKVVLVWQLQLQAEESEMQDGKL